MIDRRERQELLVTPDGGRIVRHHIISYKLMPRDWKVKPSTTPNPAKRHIYFWVTNDESGRPTDIPSQFAEPMMKLLDKFIMEGSPVIFDMTRMIDGLEKGEFFVSADANDPPFDPDREVSACLPK